MLALGSTLVAGPAAGSTATARGRSRDGGPFAVGRRTETFVDASRPTAPNNDYPGAPTRTLRTLILYPAQGDPASTTDVDNAPAVHGRRFPLVVFSHGFTASGPAYETLLRQFVAHGYVVAAPTFPLSSSGAPGGPRLLDYLNQPGDVSFVITQMLRLERRDRGTLRHLIDRHDIGTAGHSLGAITTLGVAYNTCCQDRRIEAAIPMSGIELPFGNGTFFTGLKTKAAPLFLLHGDHDQTVPYQSSVTVLAAAPPPKFFETLVGAPHTFFLSPWLDPTVKSVDDFLDAYLKHDRRALTRLAADAAVPRVTTFQQQVRSAVAP